MTWRAALAAGSLTGLLGAAAGPATAAPATYWLEPEHSFVHFEVLHFGTSTLGGRFGPIAGAVVLDRAARSGEVSLEIDLRSLDTGVRLLDRRMRERDLLDIDAQPVAWFVSRRFVFDGDRLAELRGEFTLRGVSRPLTLEAERFGCRHDTQRDLEVCGGDFVAELRRSDFGADFGLPFVADTVRLRVQAEGARR